MAVQKSKNTKRFYKNINNLYKLKLKTKKTYYTQNMKLNNMNLFKLEKFDIIFYL